MGATRHGPSETVRVWSTGDPCPGVERLLRQCGGDVDEAVAGLTKTPCSYEIARQLSEAMAHCLGLTPAEFMRRFRRRRKAGLG